MYRMQSAVHYNTMHFNPTNHSLNSKQRDAWFKKGGEKKKGKRKGANDAQPTKQTKTGKNQRKEGKKGKKWKIGLRTTWSQCRNHILRGEKNRKSTEMGWTRGGEQGWGDYEEMRGIAGLHPPPFGNLTITTGWPRVYPTVFEVPPAPQQPRISLKSHVSD